MEIIPVIDVKGGVAVAARGGARADYQPLQTPLAHGAPSLSAVVEGYLALFPFRTIYIADLDAIEGRAPNTGAIRNIAKTFPSLEIWLDNGAADESRLRGALDVERFSAVIGSETGVGAPALGKLLATDMAARLILSLDFKGETFIGDQALLEDRSIWPARIIVMTLDRVGMDAGPAAARLSQVAVRAGLRKVYAAGGVRGLDDIKALREAGAQGALVATALHAGKIKTGDLQEIAGWSFKST